jgi:transposase
MLFAVERKVADCTPEERVKVRKLESKPIVDDIRKLIDENVAKIVPRSKLGSAFGYISNEWPHLLHFLNHGFISLSNNRAENAIRSFAVGRKN